MNAPTEYKVNGVAYRQKFRQCGKPGCKCRAGKPHGPYWYAFSDVGNPKAEFKDEYGDDDSDEPDWTYDDD